MVSQWRGAEPGRWAHAVQELRAVPHRHRRSPRRVHLAGEAHGRGGGRGARFHHEVPDGRGRADVRQVREVQARVVDLGVGRSFRAFT